MTSSGVLKRSNRLRSSLYIAVIGERMQLSRERGVAALLARLGADVRLLDVRSNPAHLVDDCDGQLGIKPRAVVFDALDRPDLALGALRAVRKDASFDGAGTLLALGERHLASVDPSAGFDDFVSLPCAPLELYVRIRGLEWRRSEFASDERHKLGALVVDKMAHEVLVDGRSVSLTAKEFALLSYLCDHRGRALSRDQLLLRVWGKDYEGGRRTVDIHVRRLRAKLGASLQLETLRGWGYRLSPIETDDKSSIELAAVE